MTTAFRWLTGLMLAALLLPTVAPAAETDAIDTIKERGTLRCGVNGGVPGLSFQDEDGDWSGIDVDFCRAVAAAVLGQADKVELIPIGLAERFPALREGRIDLLVRNTTWTELRDLAEGVQFAGIYYYDGQGFMVPRRTDTLSTLELGGSTICALAGATSPENARRYFTRHRMEMKLKLFEDMDAALAAYLAGKCDTLTTDQSQLYALRSGLEQPAGQRILPEVISKEPLGPAVRKDETRLFNLVRWTLFTMIDAEELGIDSSNVLAAVERANSNQVRTLLDLDGNTADALGIEPRWGFRVISQVGNYAEVFERNLGKPSGLGIHRGLNALWRDGGLHYAPPTY